MSILSFVLVIFFLGLSFGSLSLNQNLNETGTWRYPNGPNQKEVSWIAGEFNGRTYKIHIKPQLNWLDALIACDKEKGMLTDLRDSSDYDFIRNLSSLLPSVQEAWIGTSDIILEGRFEWLTKINKSSPMNFFKKGEPNGDRITNCGVMATKGRDSRFVLDDIQCKRERPFICVFV